MTGTIQCGNLRGPYRLSYMRRKFEEVLDFVKPTVMVIEGYAMGKVGQGNSRAFDIGELGGVYKMVAWERGIDIYLVSPTALKASIIGPGRHPGGPKGKKLVMAAIRRKFGYDFNQSDEADGFGLMVMGEVRFSVSPYSAELIQSMRPAKLAEYEIIKGGKLKLISN